VLAVVVNEMAAQFKIEEMEFKQCCPLHIWSHEDPLSAFACGEGKVDAENTRAVCSAVVLQRACYGVAKAERRELGSIAVAFYAQERDGQR